LPQMRQDARQNGVLVHVGKIAGVKSVAIIHYGCDHPSGRLRLQ